MNLLVSGVAELLGLALFVALYFAWLLVSIWISEKVTGDPNGWLSVVIAFTPIVLFLYYK